MLAKQQSSSLSVVAEHLIPSLVMEKVFFSFQKSFISTATLTIEPNQTEMWDPELKTDKQIEVKS